jgi:hypothetical protein
MAENKVDVQAALGRVLIRVRDTCAKYAVEAEQIAKGTVPWKDRSKDARKLLKGYVIDDGEALGIGLAHRVEYGPYLERDGDGKYSILKPTIEGLRLSFMGAVREIMGGKGD